MSTIRFGPRDLLEYDARYGVLICRECRYAIQKSAVESHLLRHKIYRSERHDLLCQIAPLQLLEPHQVPLPAATASPIEALPVISGYRCTSAGCGCLYASSKRMKRHQNVTHGRDDTNHFLSNAHPANLQTFFRGTKLRYFEVNGQVTGDPDPTIHISDKSEPDQSIVMPPRSPPLSFPLDFDLDTLTYFHHFVTATSLMLPRPKGRGSVQGYWQTDFVRRALQDQWLMCGLLALSASHMASEIEDAAIARVHRDRSVHFFAAFSAEWDATSETADLPGEIGSAARQIIGVLRCVHWGWSESIRDASNVSETTDLPQLQSILTTVRGFADSDLTLCVDKSPGITADCLQTLPSRMADFFGKPDDVRDVLATLSAIAALVDCCDMVLASTASAWDATTDWLNKVPDHFNDLVLRGDSAALVVVAHWAALLVRLVERSGCWFFGGLSTLISRLSGGGSESLLCPASLFEYIA
ncbi:hypothetical protein P170DRAFT_392749 [Aspergillus steynii IBT 23096]|uniref:C2H2-type domain-containing protein n=1 Tax=Aspergillus steynii IBT 23096 TaxID=1392250 RepID=A0A2I2FV06_9EURO|nr:uncharacterized protein P170DRAFT_392749 [Aspergillus steynii IBT 23096]PLB44473.1 hypothetical protein P170DRAFT_392749 [Aspergillus steynii IBT 23096]